jgi:hypothetical protein
MRSTYRLYIQVANQTLSATLTIPRTGVICGALFSAFLDTQTDNDRYLVQLTKEPLLDTGSPVLNTQMGGIGGYSNVITASTGCTISQNNQYIPLEEFVVRGQKIYLSAVSSVGTLDAYCWIYIDEENLR